MAYRLKRRESVEQNLKRIVRQETGAALENLNGGRKLDQAVHEVRKSIKKTRALLRLVRPALEKTFDQENTRLRDAGRRLSDLRDAGAVLGAFDELRTERHLPPTSTAAIRRHLSGVKRRLEEEVAEANLMKGLAKVLREVRTSSSRWPLEAKGFAAIETGIEDTFRKGRDALQAARKTSDRDDLHEFRKRVKDHWYHIRLLEKLWTDVLQGYEHSLKELESALGENLNLAILRERIVVGEELSVGRRQLDGVVKAIDAKREELRARALEIGEKVYVEKPKHLGRELRLLWKAWR